MLKVKEIMTTEPAVMTVKNTIEEVRDMMAESNFRHMPIVDGNKKPLGIVSQRDVLRAQVSTLVEGADGSEGMNVSVEKIMAPRPYSVHPQDSLRGAGIMMQDKKLGCLLVVENESLVGIITDSDFVGVAINLIEGQDAAEEFGSMSDDY